MKQQRQLFGGSDKQYAVSLGINPAQLSRLLKGDIEGVLAAQKWEYIAQTLGVSAATWKAARTQVLEYIHTQLEMCQQNSMAAILVDPAGVGKTFAAKLYKRSHSNVVYVDCSQSRTRQQLLLSIAQQLGIDVMKKSDDLYRIVTYSLNTAFDHPLVILDEMGDLKLDAIQAVKAMWTAAECRSGWYAIGAEGLQARIERSIKNRVPGFVELYSRFGGTFNHAVPLDDASAQDYLAKDCAAIIKLNAPERMPEAARIIKQVDASPRAVHNILRVA